MSFDDSTVPPRLDEKHPVVVWIKNEVLPLLVEAVRPRRVVVFDPPDRPASIGGHPPGLLVVADTFRGMAVADRNAWLRTLLHSASPVRPFCLTPEEHRLAGSAPGPVLGALKTGVTILE